jgi:hypothetical protein
MKFIVWDLSNNGIIACVQTLAAANALRQGLIDTDVSYVFPGVDAYNKVNFGVVKDNLRWKVSDGSATPLKSHDINEVFIEKKRLAGVRVDAINKIVLFSIVAPRKSGIYHTAMAEADIEYSLTHSNPATDTYHDCITEYAHINRISPREAYKHLRLRSDNYRSDRMRVYSFYDYFINKVNLLENESELPGFTADMDLILRKDIYVEQHFFEGRGK